MNMTIVWSAFLGEIVIIFGCLEGYAIATKKPTLSRYIWIASKAWPPLPLFVGFAMGFLSCHFWWGGIVSFAPVKFFGG